MMLFCLEELRSVLDEMNNLRRVLQIPVQIYCANKNYIVSINIPEWWAMYRYLIYEMMGQSYYQSEAKNQNERYKGCRNALNARRGNFLQDLLSLYIFPLDRRKAVLHKFVRRTCLSVLYTGIACTLGFSFFGSSWMPLWPEARLLKREVFREIRWDMEINLGWQDENLSDKLPLPWRLCTKVKPLSCCNEP